MANSSPVHRIKLAAAVALEHAESLLSEWLPEGKRQGTEWQARNVARGDRSPGSFGVSLISGKWNDFAADDAHGGDLVSLLAYLRGYRQIDAAREIDQQLSAGLFGTDSHHSPAIQRNTNDALRAAEVRSAREREERLARQAKAARRARELWRGSREASPAHPYLSAKHLPPLMLRQRQGELLIPLIHNGRLVNLQRIDADGNKRFLSGGKVNGCHAFIRRRSDGPRRLYVCEGWATGATLHVHTAAAVACAMNAGNLRKVAVALRERYGPGLEMVIAGDDDRNTSGNPGATAANAAALAAGAMVVFPEWPDGAPEHLTDFNDLHCWAREQIREVS